MLLDLTERGLTGKDVEAALDRAGITTNKNGIPFDRQGPQVTSGIRIGTPAITTRGMKEEEMKEIARMIALIISDIGDENTIAKVRGEVAELCGRFPLYPGRIEK